MLCVKIMVKELNNTKKQPVWWWLTLALLVFITISPFLVTVSGFRYLSLLRELLVLSLIFIGFKDRQRKKIPIIKDDLERLIFWLVALGLLSTLFITQDIGAFLWSARYSILPLSIFWSLHAVEPSQKSIQQLATTWLLWSCLIIIFGLVMVGLIPKETLIAWGYNPEVAVGNGQWQAAAVIPAYQTVAGSIPRLQSTMSGPIQFAGFSLLVVFLAPFIKQTKLHFLYPAVILLGIVGVIGSFSRAAWLALIFGGAYLLLRYFIKRGWKKSEVWALFFICIFTIIAIGGQILFQPNAERQRQLVADIFNRSISDREHVNSIGQSLKDYQTTNYKKSFLSLICYSNHCFVHRYVARSSTSHNCLCLCRIIT